MPRPEQQKVHLRGGRLSRPPLQSDGVVQLKPIHPELLRRMPHGVRDQAVSSNMAPPIEASGPLGTAPPTKAAGSSTTQTTQAAGPPTTAEPTDAAPSHPEPSSANVSNKQTLALCVCIILILNLLFV